MIKLPREAAKYIALQRLETQKLGGAIHYTFLGKIAYYIYENLPIFKKVFSYYSMHVEPNIRYQSIVEDYSEIMKKEFDNIRPHIKDTATTFLSIGPGVAGLEIFLSNHFRARELPEPKIILVDKSTIDPIKYGFHEKAAAYNSLALAKEILVDNGNAATNIHLFETEEIKDCIDKFSGQVDLITSLIAWGFHFPVDTYLEFSKTILKENGGLIIDVRKGTDGLEKLKTVFKNISIIHDDPKFERVLAVGKK